MTNKDRSPGGHRYSASETGALNTTINTLATDPGNPQTWDATWGAAFRKLKNDGEVDRDKLLDLLRLVGYSYPDKNLCAQVAKSVTKYQNLNAEEVYDFLKKFEDAVRAEVQSAFSDCASKYGGKVPVRELEGLISLRGFTPIPHAMLEVLMEAADEVKMDLEQVIYSGSGVPLNVFMVILDLLEQREGFCKGDLVVLEGAFEQYDKNKNGFIDSRELPDLLESLDFCLDMSVIQSIVSLPLRDSGGQSDARDSVGALTWKDFLMVMRKRVALEFELCQNLFNRYDDDVDGLLRPGQVMRLFAKLGVSMLPETLADVIGECEINGRAIDFQGFWKLLQTLRVREGFTAKEAEEIRDVFRRFDSSGRGEMPVKRVSAALTWLGYENGCFGEMGKANRRLSLPSPSSGYVTEVQFLKLVRKHREAELRVVRNVFRHFAEDGGAGKITMSKLGEAVSKLGRGFDPDFNEWMKTNRPGARVAKKHVSFDFEEFRKVVLYCREKLRDRSMKNCGFSPVQLSRFRIEFVKYTQDKGSTTVNAKGAIKLFADMVPLSQTSVEVRDRLRKALATNNSKNGSLDWHSFLCVMRAYEDLVEVDAEHSIQAGIEALSIPSNCSEEAVAVVTRFRQGANALTEEDVIFLAKGLEPDLTVEQAREVLTLLRGVEREMAENEAEEYGISQSVRCFKEILSSGGFSAKTENLNT